MLPQLFLLGLRSLFVSASDDDEAVVEDEQPQGGLPFPGGKMPTPEELLKMLDSMTGLSDEEKESLRRDLLKNAAGGGAPGGAFDDESTRHVATSFFASQFFILLIMLTIVAMIFGITFFFCFYRLLINLPRDRIIRPK